jgi:TPR repeat protein
MRAWIEYSAAALLLLVTALVSTPAVAEPSRDAAPGVAAYEAGEYERAYDLLKPVADAGDVQARYLMARLLAGDFRERKSYSDGFKYLDRSVRCYNAEALSLYGYLLARADSETSQQIHVKQAKIYKEAAHMGSLKALFNLGWVLARYLDEPVLGGAYIYEAARKGHPQAEKGIANIQNMEAGHVAIQAIEKKVREEPFESRWPSLTQFDEQCS